MDYAYSVLDSAKSPPFYFLTHEFDGDWVREISPRSIPEQPILFYELKKGNFSHVNLPGGLVLFHRDLIDFFDGHLPGAFERYQAVITPPRSDVENTDFFVVKIPATTSLDSLSRTVGCPSLSVVADEPGSVLVSNELRAMLEESPLSGFEFCEPFFCY